MKLYSKLHALLRQNILRDTARTTVFSVAGKGVGFLVPFFIAHWFGVSSTTDAFFFAYGLIVFMATIFSPVVENIVVPFVAEARARQEDVGKFIGRVLGMSAALLLVVLIVFGMAARITLPYLTKFSPEGLRLIYSIMLESAPLVILIVWSSVLAGTLNAYKVFSVPALSPAFRGIINLAVIFMLKNSMGVHAIALGYLLGELFRTLMIMAIIRKLRLCRLRLSFGWNPKFNEFLKTSSFQVAGMTAMAFLPMINKAMASWLGSGKVSLIEYADRLYMIPSNLMSEGLMVTLFSYWSSRFQHAGREGLRKDVHKAIRVLTPAVLLFSLLFIVMRGYLVEAVYGHGKVSAESMDDIGGILAFYFIGLTPQLLTSVYVKAFLVMKKTKTLMFIAFFVTVEMVVLNYFMIGIIGIAGFALTKTLVEAVSLVILSAVFYRTLTERTIKGAEAPIVIKGSGELTNG